MLKDSRYLETRLFSAFLNVLKSWIVSLRKEDGKLSRQSVPTGFFRVYPHIKEGDMWSPESSSRKHI